MSPLAIEFHELAAQVREQHEARERAAAQRRAERLHTVPQRLPEAYARLRLTCCLCANESTTFICARCAHHLETTGGTL